MTLVLRLSLTIRMLSAADFISLGGCVFASQELDASLGLITGEPSSAPLMSHVCVTGSKTKKNPVACNVSNWSLADRNTTKWVSVIRPREEACFSETHIHYKMWPPIEWEQMTCVRVKKKCIQRTAPLSYSALCAENRWAVHILQPPPVHVHFTTL